MPKIKHIAAREVLDGKGNPTVEATVVLDNDTTGLSICPSGTSIGKYEAHELRDGTPERFRGLGVLKAVQNINEIIAPKLMGMEIAAQQKIDHAMIELDGTEDKSLLGGNAILAVSMASAKALATYNHLPLYRYLHELLPDDNNAPKIPTPLFNILNGGKHAGENVDFQEFMVIPTTNTSFTDALSLGWNVYHTLSDLLKRNNLSVTVGDEGGFAPLIAKNEDGLSLLMQAVDTAGFRLGYDVFLGLDTAAGSFFHTDHYKIKDKTAKLSAKDLILFYSGLIKPYHLLYLEDPLAEDDLDGWKEALATLGNDALIVGDDLTATNPYRLQLALNEKTINSIIIKPNQIGTVIEALAVVEIARKAGIKVIVSHRSGDTTDDFIADFAVAVAADYVKFGAPARGERIAKYNRLLTIDTEINSKKVL